jgi:hypothetical protein
MAAQTTEEAKEWVKYIQNSINIANYFESCENIVTVPLLETLEFLSEEKELLQLKESILSLKSIKAISSLVLPTIKSLKKLIITDCNLNDDHMKILATGIAKNDNLNLLNLSNNKISNNGVNDLLNSLYISITIEDLDLSYNDISG